MGVLELYPAGKSFVSIMLGSIGDIVNLIAQSINFIFSFSFIVINTVLFLFTHMTFFFMLFEMFALVMVLTKNDLLEMLDCYISTHISFITFLQNQFKFVISISKTVYDMVIQAAQVIADLVPFT